MGRQVRQHVLYYFTTGGGGSFDVSARTGSINLGGRRTFKQPQSSGPFDKAAGCDDGPVNFSGRRTFKQPSTGSPFDRPSESEPANFSTRRTFKHPQSSSSPFDKPNGSEPANFSTRRTFKHPQPSASPFDKGNVFRIGSVNYGGRRTFKQPPSLQQSSASLASTRSTINLATSNLSLRAAGKNNSGDVTSASVATDLNKYGNDDGGWNGTTTILFDKKASFKRAPKNILVPGVSVLCVHSKELAVVKYVGSVGFADGSWLGLELKEGRTGRHDGVVDGKRYFTCAPNRGVMLRPKMVSIHGINGAEFIKS